MTDTATPAASCPGCGNPFDGDNYCMPSACQWEGMENEGAAARLEAAARLIPGRAAASLRHVAREIMHARGAVGGAWAREASRILLGLPVDDGR